MLFFFSEMATCSWGRWWCALVASRAGCCVVIICRPKYKSKLITRGHKGGFSPSACWLAYSKKAGELERANLMKMAISLFCWWCHFFKPNTETTGKIVLFKVETKWTFERSNNVIGSKATMNGPPGMLKSPSRHVLKCENTLLWFIFCLTWFSHMKK